MSVIVSDGITLEDLRPGDEPVLFELYAAVRSEELGMQDWPDEMRARVLRTQFDAQRRGYRDQFPNLDEQLILCDGSPVGWVVVDRSGSRELHGIDIALLAGARQRGVGTRVMRSLLFDLSPTDPITYGAIVVLIVITAAAASWVPARRAANVDPLASLRSE